MLTDNIFSHILIEPALQFTNTRLQIVSGFATAGMADRHFEELAKQGRCTSVELIVGMTGFSGIEAAQHEALCKLVRSRAYGIDFSCRYIADNRPVHAKAYVWLNESGPFKAFCGSANYTMAGFVRPQVEAMAQSDPSSVSEFYNECLAYALDCLDETVSDHVALKKPQFADEIASEDFVTLKLLDTRTGETHKRSGLNWGQRPGRDPDQAYIPIPVQHYDFFPAIGERFTVRTDDGYNFIFVRAQQRGKALHTTQNNAWLGQYLRRRLNVPLGVFVTKQHLVDYGRDDVTFIKENEETYHMDFSPSAEFEHRLEGEES